MLERRGKAWELSAAFLHRNVSPSQGSKLQPQSSW